MYHDPVPDLAQQFLAGIRRHNLLKPGDRVGAAVSGGADSVALLHLLLQLRSELGIVLSVVHFNHQLRGSESDADQAFVEGLARHHGLEIHLGRENVAQQAAASRKGLEHTAREIRYGYFASLISQGTLNKVATGHTLDDQAETVMMHVIRGTGLEGLAGIRPSLDVMDAGEQVRGAIIRPMLGVRRCDVEEHLRQRRQTWHEDSSNTDLRFTRNRLRHELMPLLQAKFNAGVVDALGTLSEIAQAEELFWRKEIAALLRSLCKFSPPESAAQYNLALASRVRSLPTPGSAWLERQPGPLPMNITIDAGKLSAQPLAVQRRLIMHLGKSVLMPMDFAHIESLLELAGPDVPSGKQLTLPLGWRALRQGGTLQLLTPDLRTPERFPSEYRYTLPVPGSVAIWERRRVIEAVPVKVTAADRDSLYSPDKLPSQLLIRNWRPGDRFHPAHTKSAKKVKELLSERHVPASERKLWPVALADDDIIWLQGFPAPAKLQPAPGSKTAILIRESELVA
jgi:tRNA(Ile)-lysidine synthase